MTMKKVGDQTIGVIQRRRIDKEGNVSRFQEYHTSDEEEEELRFMACGLRDFDKTGGAVALTKWIEKMEYVIDNSRCLANQRVKYANDFKALLTTEFCPSNEIEKLEGEFWDHSMVGADHVGYTDRFHMLAKLVPHLVTPKVKHVTRYINRLPSQIHGMLRATQPATIQAAILTVGILTDEANKKAKRGRGFVAAVPPRRENGNFPKCARCNGFHAEKGPCLMCYNCQRPGHMDRDSRAPVRHVEPIRAVRPRNGQRACYE
ncbi:hypothetical protein Tco_0349579 [Tanacetum coccineum]